MGIQYVIELSKWGIKQGVFGKPPYTASQWKTAYNNLIGFNNALKFANDNGYGLVIVPKGQYTFCYTNLSGGSEPASMINTSIRLFSNQTLDLNGSEFIIIYDSINKNPYDKSPATVPAWKLSGKLIQILDCTNTHILNGKITGEIPNRSFSDTGSGFNSEKGMEQTYAIEFQYGSKNCSVKNIDVSMFMGDGIAIGSSPTRNGTWDISKGQTTAAPGFIGPDGKLTQEPGAYLSPKYSLIQGEHKLIQMRSGGGYTRIVPIANETFTYLFYDRSNTIILRKKAIYLQTVAVPFNAVSVQLQFENETPGLQNLTLNYAITKPQSSHITIADCEIHDNHRGGISGGADFTVISGNEIYNNGMDSGIGVPLFPDSTRYAIDFEDSYSNYVKIENNHIFNGFHGMLLGAYHIHVSMNLFSDLSSGVIIYNNASTIIDGNEFYDCNALSLQSSISSQKRKIAFTENLVSGLKAAIFIDASSFVNTKAVIEKNRFYIDSFSFYGDIELAGNYFKSYSGAKNLDYLSSTLNCKKMTDNVIEDYNYGSHYRLGVSNYDTESINEANIYKSVYLGSNDLANDVYLNQSEFYSSIVECQVIDLTKSSSITFRNCRLFDTKILLGNRYINDITNGGVSIECSFNECDILLTENYADSMLVGIADNKGLSEYTQGTEPRSYKVSLYKCTFTDSITSKNTYLLKYLYNGDFDIQQVKTVFIDESKLSISDITKFSPVKYDSPESTSHSAIIKNSSWTGFTDFVKPLNAGKLEVYNEVFAPYGPVPPPSLELRIGTCWFNTVNNKPYWYNGTGWVDSAGNTLS